MNKIKILGIGAIMMVLLMSIAPAVSSNTLTVIIDGDGKVIEVFDIDKEQSVQPEPFCPGNGPWNLSRCFPHYNHFLLLYGWWAIESIELSTPPPPLKL